MHLVMPAAVGLPPPPDGYVLVQFEFDRWQDAVDNDLTAVHWYDDDKYFGGTRWAATNGVTTDDRITFSLTRCGKGTIARKREHISAEALRVYDRALRCAGTRSRLFSSLC